MNTILSQFGMVDNGRYLINSPRVLLDSENCTDRNEHLGDLLTMDIIHWNKSWDDPPSTSHLPSQEEEDDQDSTAEPGVEYLSPTNGS